MEVFRCAFILILMEFIPTLTNGQNNQDDLATILNNKDPPFMMLKKNAKPPVDGLLKLQYSLPFYGRKFDSVVVSSNGYLLMGKENWHNYGKFPVENPGAPNADKPLIAVFLSAFEFALRTKGPPEISYRVFYPETSQATLESYSTEVKERILGSQNFVATGGIEVVWSNMTEIYSDVAGTTTFRLALLTDGEKTYALLQFYNLVAPTLKNVKAAIGFNAGTEQGWYPLPLSGTNDVKQLEDLGSLDPGKFYFEVSSNHIVRGGCWKIGSQFEQELQTDVHNVGMFGGDMVRISGPCMEQGGDIPQVKCRFGSQTVDGIAENSYWVFCNTPHFFTIGDIEVDLSLDGGITWSGKPTHLHISLPIDETFGVELKMEAEWRKRSPDFALEFSWDEKQFNSNVDVAIYGYREDKADKAEWKLLTTIETNIPNSGMHQFEARDVKCNNDDCDLFDMGSIVVRSSNLNSPLIWSKPFMLTWFIDDKLTREEGKNWPLKHCHQWHENDKRSTDWRQGLPVCPCNMEQARADFGRWEPDSSCNIEDENSKCTYHVGAKHCVLSVTQTDEGSGNQCCYDDKSLLMYSQDINNGSTPDRAAKYGKFPYGKPPMIPLLSHWVDDVVPFYYCCLYENSCNSYMTLRETIQCKDYEPPKLGSVFGDPHFERFDGQTITFNGIGEYWLLKETGVNGLKIQVRLSRMEIASQPGSQQDNPTLSEGTIVTSVSMQFGETDTVEIRKTPSGWTNTRKLDVWINQKEQHFFNDSSQLYQKFIGFNVNRQRPVDSSSFIVTFTNGVGVKVMVVNGLLEITVSAPSEFKGTGILGTWSTVTKRDLTEYEKVSTNTLEIYTQVKNDWKIQEAESLFKYSSGVAYEYINDDNSYVPRFNLEATGNVNLSDVEALCGADDLCKFDYIVTENSDVATATKKFSNNFKQLLADTDQVPTCGLLDIPNSVKDSNDYRVGGMVRIKGCRPGFVQKNTAVKEFYTCKDLNGVPTWTPEVNYACGELAGTEVASAGSGGIIAGAIIAVIVIGALIAVIVYFTIRHKREMKKNKDDEESPEDVKKMSELEKAEHNENVMSASRDEIAPKSPGSDFSPSSGKGVDNQAVYYEPDVGERMANVPPPVNNVNPAVLPVDKPENVDPGHRSSLV